MEFETEQEREFNIIIVDDSAFTRNYLSDILTSHQYNIVGVAGSAKEAIVMIKERKPHLVICDVVMPEMSGIDLAKKCFDLELGAQFIMVSSLTHEHIVFEAISAGAVDYIQKPVQIQQLIDSIEKVKNMKSEG